MMGYKKQTLLFILAGILLLVACGHQLEREGIPLVFGVSLDENSNLTELTESFDALISMNQQSVVLKIPLIADSTAPDHPYIHPSLSPKLDHFFAALTDSDFEYHLFLSHENIKWLFPTWNVEEPQKWFDGLLYAVDSLLLLHPKPPKTIILGNDWIPLEKFESEWDAFARNLKSRYNGKITYSASITRTEMIDIWDHLDYIGVSYPPVPEAMLKKFSMDWNPKIEQVALAHNLPIIITEANIVGQQPELIFKNRIRFWSDTVDIEMIHLNTLYPHLITLDSVTYYGLRHEEEFNAYLKKYLQLTP